MFQFSTLVPHSNVHVFAFVCRFIYRQNYYPKCAISHPTIEVDSEVCPVLNWKILPGLINAHSVVSRCHLNQSAQHLFGWHTELASTFKRKWLWGLSFLGQIVHCIELHMNIAPKCVIFLRYTQLKFVYINHRAHIRHTLRVLASEILAL